MKKKTKKLKACFNNLFATLYLGNSTTIITICWIIASFHLTIIYNYQDCLNTYDDKNTFIFIFWFALGTIFIIFLPIITYFFIHKKKIGKDKDNRIEENNGNFDFAEINPKVFILPMYLLWVFSLSKLIVILYQSFNNGMSEDIIIKVIILFVILIGSFWAWVSFKKTSTKSWSFWITFFAIIYVSINIGWEHFLPFLQSYLLTLNCIFNTIIK